MVRLLGPILTMLTGPAEGPEGYSPPSPTSSRSASTNQPNPRRAIRSRGAGRQRQTVEEDGRQGRQDEEFACQQHPHRRLQLSTKPWMAVVALLSGDELVAVEEGRRLLALGNQRLTLSRCFASVSASGIRKSRSLVAAPGGWHWPAQKKSEQGADHGQAA